MYSMDNIDIRPYKNRKEMTAYELKEHRAKLMSVSNKRAYIKRKRERNYYIDTYNEIVEAVEELSNEGYYIDKELVNALTICEDILGYEPRFIFE